MKKTTVTACLLIFSMIFQSMSWATTTKDDGYKPFNCYFFLTPHLLWFLSDPLNADAEWLYKMGAAYKTDLYPEKNKQGEIYRAYNREIDQSDYELCVDQEKLFKLIQDQGITDTIKDSLIFWNCYFKHYIIAARSEENVYFIPLLAGKSEFRFVKNHHVYSLEEFKKICGRYNYKMFVFGKEIKPPVLPYGELDIVRIPVRAYFEARGYKVLWDAKERTITIPIDGHQYTMRLPDTNDASVSVFLDGKNIEYKCFYNIENGCTMVPVYGSFVDFVEQNTCNRSIATTVDLDQRTVSTDTFIPE